MDAQFYILHPVMIIPICVKYVNIFNFIFFSGITYGTNYSSRYVHTCASQHTHDLSFWFRAQQLSFFLYIRYHIHTSNTQIQKGEQKYEFFLCIFFILFILFHFIFLLLVNDFYCFAISHLVYTNTVKIYIVCFT